uniref:Uncharacterized protein n=1 Tax=Schistosoma curassoni TaxID=6186 RepID=A0A183K6M2_9TREM
MELADKERADVELTVKALVVDTVVVVLVVGWCEPGKAGKSCLENSRGAAWLFE